jgi:hypothetical protein
MSTVRVFGPEGRVLKERFIALKWHKSLVDVEGVTSKRRITIHCTRVIKEEDMAKLMAAKAVKSVGIQLDWKKVVGERWSKSMAFDHKEVKAAAHVVVDKPKKTYRSFNTYNGSLGKQGKMGKIFRFKDYDQLVARLLSRNYRRVVARGPAREKVVPSPVSIVDMDKVDCVALPTPTTPTPSA